jgi:chromosome segregation and condensation protein ScpB
VDRQDTPGRPRLFGTTLRFLQIVGLERVDDLPPLGEAAAIEALGATAGSSTDSAGAP